GYLTREQILLLLTADPGSGEVYAPDWLIEDCHDRGLITPGDGPGRWRLSGDGWDAWNALLD
ncbi:hypothetical protein, partial [Azospirillum himalayense]